MKEAFGMRRGPALFALFVPLAFSACSKEEPPEDKVIDCVGCVVDGDECDYSINCQAGSICNQTTEELYDSTKGSDICVKVVCASSADCTAPKECSLQRICEAPVCQSDTECTGGNVCLSGKCEPAPAAADVASCVVASKGGAIRQGATQDLVAVAMNANGVVLAKIAFTWESDDTGAVSVTGATATGGATSGPATLTAKVTGNDAVTCTGDVTLNNFASLPAGQSRVVVVSSVDGAPVTTAQITITSAGVSDTQTAEATGSKTFAVASLEQVTVTAAGYDWVTVLRPGTNDVFISLPKVADLTKAGGVRGSIDLSATKKADIQIGIAAPAIPSNLLDFDFNTILGDFINTTIDAPELGLDNQEVDLPGGVMFALGSNKFTDDSQQTGGGFRCQGKAPLANEIGCYLARAPEGPGAAWALAGQLKLSAITPIAGKLSSAVGGSDGEEIPVGDILSAVLPLFQKLNHGITSGLTIEEFPKVPADATTTAADCANASFADYEDHCRADYSKYKEIKLAASQKLGVLSTVTMPMLPSTGAGTYASGAVVIAGSLGPAGLIPLGLAAGLDVLEDEAADGKIAGIEEPFGQNSATLNDNEVGLALAPPHSGIEGSRIALVGIALDIDQIAGGGGLALSGIVKFADAGVQTTESFGSATFLGYPAGTFASATRTFTPSSALVGNVTRLELARNGQTWLIYAPGGSADPIVLPTFEGSPASTIVGSGMDAFVQGVKSPAQFSEVFQFGSGKNLDKALEFIDAFVVQQCVAPTVEVATPTCRLE
ncbi:MAG: hypothetical protein HYV07_24240 [Deltaproteobacteria bacterium]|nr:hypothetical protein [Deltaproteobacteria bacterium]